jgi:hypothetical protein
VSTGQVDDAAPSHRRRTRAPLIGAVVVAAAAVAWFVAGRHSEMPSMSLVDAYPTTAKRSPYGEVEAFSVYDATVGEETKRAVYARPPSRITWKVTPPPASELRAWLALRKESWSQLGNGVVFRIGVSDGRKYDELLTRHVNPYGAPDDRRWIPVAIDLSPFAGKAVDIIFNTDPSPPGVPADGRNDLALWGEPTVASAR